MCNSLKRLLKNNQYITRTIQSGMEAIKEIELSAPDLMLLDHRLGDMTGMDVLKQVKAKHPDLVVIMITAFGNISLAVEAMKNRQKAKRYDEYPAFLLDQSTILDVEYWLRPILHLALSTTLSCSNRRRWSKQ